MLKTFAALGISAAIAFAPLAAFAQTDTTAPAAGAAPAASDAMAPAKDSMKAKAKKPKHMAKKAKKTGDTMAPAAPAGARAVIRQPTIDLGKTSRPIRPMGRLRCVWPRRFPGRLRHVRLAGFPRRRNGER